MRFHPAVLFEGRYTDNVRFAPVGQETSDQVGWLQLLLPLEQRGPNGGWALEYAPAVERFSDASELDHDEHRFQFSGDRDWSRRTAITYSLGYQKSQTTINPAGEASSDLVLSGRQNLDRISTSFRLDRRSSTNRSWYAQVGGSDYRYSSVGDLGTSAEDRREYNADIGLRGAWNRNTRVGVEVGYRIYELEISGEEDVTLVSATLGRDLGRAWTLDLWLGGFYRDISRPQGAGATGVDSESGPQGRIELARARPRVQWRMNASHQTSVGGVSAGTATDTTGSIAVVATPTPNWTCGANVRYTLRESVDGSFGDTSTGALGSNVEWRPNGFWGIRMSAGLIDQTTDAVGDGAPVDLQAAEVRLGVVWYPRGAREAGGGA